MEDNSTKILIVDDDSFLLDMYALKFSKSSFNVITAPGPVQALETLRKGISLDIILLDIMMPVMDGFELLEKIKEENLTPDSVTIFLSNRGQSSDTNRAEALGASGYIVKASSTPSEVIQEVVRIYNKSKKK